MKWFGAFLLLVSGYLLSRRLAEPGIRHVELLEEGEYLFRLLESEIRNAKIPRRSCLLTSSAAPDLSGKDSLPTCRRR